MEVHKIGSSAYSTKSIAIIGLLSSMAAVSRIFFSFIPSVNPASFIIIITGVVLGGNYGFMTGALCAILSNIILGQGPWTIFQIVCWGLMGLTADWCGKVSHRNITMLSVFGLVWGFVFGWVMNLWYVIGDFNWVTYLSACISSFSFDLAHGVTNVILMGVLGNQCMKILERNKGKM